MVARRTTPERGRYSGQKKYQKKQQGHHPQSREYTINHVPTAKNKSFGGQEAAEKGDWGPKRIEVRKLG